MPSEKPSCTFAGKAARLKIWALMIPLPAPGQSPLSPGGSDRVRSLALTMTDPQIIATLNQEHLLSATGKPFSLSMIKWIRARHGIPAPALKKSEELTVGQVAKRLASVSAWSITGSNAAIFRRASLDQGRPTGSRSARKAETRLQAWVTNSNRITPAPSQNAVASGAI